MAPRDGRRFSRSPTALPYTFYDRYTPAASRTADRRQPLPSTFAARYIQGGAGDFWTNLTIWREGITGPGASCASYYNTNSFGMPIGEIVRFDEHENASVGTTGPVCTPCPTLAPTFPPTSSANTAGGSFPYRAGPDVGGWMYLNLDNGGAKVYSVTSPTNGTTTGPAVTP